MSVPPFPNAPRPPWYRSAQWNEAGKKRNGVHYVGDSVEVDWGGFQKLTADFEGGVDGQPVTTGAGEGSLTPWSRIDDTDLGNTVVYSTLAAHGALSARMINGGFSLGPRLVWSGLGISHDHYGRGYMYWPDFPASPFGFVRARLQGENCWSLSLDSSGIVTVYDNAFSPEAVFSTPIALNQWVRIEYRANHTGNSLEVKLFNTAESSTPTETQIGSDAALRSAADEISFSGGHLGDTMYWDDIVTFATAYPGPYGASDHNPNSDDDLEYVVRDFYGKRVSDGTMPESDTVLIPREPSGGWKPGWYRINLSGPQSDTNFAQSYGVTNFCVVRQDPHFVPMPAGNVEGSADVGNDLVMKGVMGLGTSRISITDAANPDIAGALQDIALTKTYWTATGTPDTERPTREPWITFPNGGADSQAQLDGVTDVVAAAYPDCKYFEGPSNEPNMTSATAQKMEDFAAAVHAGNPNAKAIGPCPVALHPIIDWTPFLDAGGGAHCDEISFHAYNATTNGDLNLGRHSIQVLLDLLDSYGLAAKPLWQTESCGPNSSMMYGVYHPRRARKAMIEWMLFEQMGVPRERNNWWYDLSHGFWAAPSWIENRDGSLEPAAVLGRVMAEETWGKPYVSALDFGTLGNAMFLGNVYTNAAGESTLAIVAASYMTGGSVALAISGTTEPVAVVDSFGREATMPQSRGRITLPVTEVPIYVSLPTGATATVFRVNGHSPRGTGVSISPTASSKELGGVSYPVIADDGYMTLYASSAGIAPTGTNVAQGVPSNATLVWAGDKTIERVIVWCGPAWQAAGTIVKYEVQTYDGADWTTRASISKPTPSYVYSGTDDMGCGCFVETYWDEQWIHDVELEVPVSCQGVRLNVTEASFGGEPLPTGSPAQFGQGHPTQGYKIQEIAVTDANRYAGVG